MPVYNKLVRDLIPQIIENQGTQFKTRILDDDEYITALQTKLQEELREYLESDNDANSLEELADILELINALAKTHGSSMEQLEQIRKQKAAERGGFHDKIYLIEVEDDQD